MKWTCFLLCLYILFAELAVADPIKPPALKKGGTVALVSPAKGTTQERIGFITKGLEKMGYSVKEFGAVTGQWGYLSESDEERAAAIMTAWRDPEVDAIFCTIGGYGTTRFVDMLDYPYIQKHPKIITGFSDITGLHLALFKQAGIVTFHSPTTQYVYGGDFEARRVATPSFWNTIAEERVKDSPPPVYTSDDFTSKVETLVPGVAKGRLVGGNLSLVHALQGTPYEIETDGRILFLEDVGEEPYRIDRMIQNLELSGKLENPAGVILGLWRGCEPENPERSFTPGEVFEQYFAGRPYPVMKNFPIGHVEENITMPLGVMAEMDAGAGKLRLLEHAVQVSE